MATLGSIAARFSKPSLEHQIALSLLAFGLLGLAAILLLLSGTVDQRFSRLEEQEIAGHLDRAGAMLERMQQTAESQSLDWAVWDDTFKYLHTGNPLYEKQNFTPSAFQNIDSQAMGFVRFDGTFSKGVYFDLKRGQRDTKNEREFTRVIATPEFRSVMRGRTSRMGFIRLGDRILVIAAAQVFLSDGLGTPEGYLVTGAELTGKDLAQALQVSARLDPTAHGAPVQIRHGEDRISIARQIRALTGEPIATVRFSVPRSLKKEGAALLWLTAAGIAALVMLTILLLAWRLRVILIRPIKTFQAHVSAISRSGELSAFAEERDDELGALYREFNTMAAELNSLRSEVETQSFAIGQSESAIGIMHNVRNAISPVHAILSKLDDSMQFPAETNVRRALDELVAGTAAPERQAQLLAFLGVAIARAREDLGHHRVHLREALQALGQVVEAIMSAQTVSPQQSHVPPAECDLSAVIGSSLAIVRHHSSLGMTAEFHTDERFRIAAPRVLLAQVIDNLLTNAAEAIAATGRAAGAISIHASRDPDEPDHLIRLTIGDDGDGFSPGQAVNLFERGKSSRDKGAAGGIGLHWCANTLNALGGSIAIASAGPGLGAQVTLRLPIAVTDPVSDCQVQPAKAA